MKTPTDAAGLSDEAGTRAGPAPAGAPHPQTHKWIVVVALMLATALSALDANIVGTAVPTIVGQLGGLPLLPWLVTSFMLTSTTAVPVCGKLADIYGRKPLLMAGAGIFVGGSMLCGLAGSMEQLIAYRALQGLGAGCIVPVTLTLIGDLFGLEERARMQGLFSGVWGVSSLLGPLAAGIIVTTVGWPWIFFVNLPFGLASMALIARFLREPPRAAGSLKRIDFPGAVTLTLGVAAALLALSVGSSSGWSDPAVLALAGSASVLLALFFLAEKRAAEPLVDLEMLRNRLSSVSATAGFLSAGLLFGCVAYLPLMVQGVWQGSPLEAGLALAPLSIGWPLASSTAGRLIIRSGYWPVAFGGASLGFAGSLMMLPLGPRANLLLLGLALFVMGCGLGFSFTAILTCVQNSVGWSQRWAATSLLQFSRNMGGTVAVAVLGVVLTAGLSANLAALPPSQTTAPGLQQPPAAGGVERLGPASRLLDPEQRGNLEPGYRLALQGALSELLRPVLFLLAALSGLSLAVTWFFPRILVARKEKARGVLEPED